MTTTNTKPLHDRFGFFDRTQEYSVSWGQLPHWEQPGASYFITFRTADSLPAEAIELWERQRDDWLKRHGINPSLADWHKQFRDLSHAQQRVFHREFATRLETQLDDLHGECVLGKLELAKIVADSLHHFDGDRDQLGDFVVMPNHVHLIVCFTHGTRLREQCYSWKHYTARQINRQLGRTGEFWQTESFDHLIRDGDHFQRFRNYIANNPQRANLRDGEFIHYRCAD